MRIIGLIFIVSIFNARAEILLNEPFPYADGVLQEVSLGKWVGHSGETNQVDVTDNAVNLTEKEAQDVNALLLHAPFTGTSGAVLYMAFKINFSALPTKTGGYFSHFKSASATGFRCRIWATLTPEKKINLGITSAASSDPILHPMPLELNTEYMVVARLDVGTSLATLWIDPVTEQDASVQSETGPALTITSFALRQASGIGILRLDEVIVATTFEELTGTIANRPRVVRPPQDVEVTEGTPADFSVEAAGSEPLYYQWFFKEGELLNATNSTLTISETAATNAGGYKVRISNSAGSVWSDVATLTVNAPVAAPEIVRQPEDTIIDAGENGTLSVMATGTEPLLYQWYFNGMRLPKETNSTLSFINPAISASGDYKVTISNSAGIAFSEFANLTVLPPQFAPSITVQPMDITVADGESAEFSATASGTPPLLYQWYFSENELKGETNSSLRLFQVAKENEGSFKVQITNQKGSVTSAAAHLEVTTPVLPNPPTITFINYLERLVRLGDLETNMYSEFVLRAGENLKIEAAIEDTDGRTLSVFINTNELPVEAHWVTLLKTPTTVSGTFQFAPAISSAGETYTFRIEARDSETTNQFFWSIHVPDINEQNIVITEFLANPETSPTSLYFNPLHRITPSSDPEHDDSYVELTNSSSESIDLKNWTISGATNVWHEFIDTFIMEPWTTVIVYGGSRSGTEPMPGTATIPANAPSLSLENGDAFGGILYLRGPEGKLISRIVYEALHSPSSMTRFPDVNGAFTPQESVGTNLFSPGKNWNGEPFAESIQPRAVGEVRIERLDMNQVRLTWQAGADQKYTILRTTSITEPFTAITPSLQFTIETGEFTDTVEVTGALFYQVRSP